jgi:hypothetical protein
MLVGVCGLKNSGKDSIGDVLVKEYGFTKLSFAKHLKDVASVLFGMDRKMLAGETPEDREIREKPDKFWSEKLGKDFTPRMALQILGTNLLRNQFHENIWVDCLEKTLLENPDKNYVITDVRFPNEIEMIRKNKGAIWRVERGELPSWYKTCESIGQEIIAGNDVSERYNEIVELKTIHESEWKWIGIDNPDRLFKNNGTLNDLANHVITYMINKYGIK